MKHKWAVNSIGFKMVAAFVLVALTVALTTAGLFRWSVHSGFLDYVNAVERERLGALAADMAGRYRQEQSWQFLQSQPRRWFRSWRRGRGFHRGGMQPVPPDGGPRGPGARLSLLDADGRLLAGWPPGPDGLKEPVNVDGKTVGYLALAPAQALTERLDRMFFSRQVDMLYWITGLALLCAVAVAVPLSRWLVAPVRVLAGATRDLAGGRLESRITVDRGDELGRLAADFNRLAEGLERNRDGRQRWLADISHELRTPLTVLRAELQALEDGVRPFDRAACRSLSLEMQRLSKLVEDLNELTLSDIGALDYRWAPVNPVSVIQQSLDGFRARLAERSLAVHFEPDRSGMTVRADARRLGQLFDNLLENSCRYTDPGGRIEIRLRDDGDTVEIRIDDSAPGVPAEALPRLFERLYRVDASRRRETGGAGLGLAICENIVQAHGGDLQAEASPLGGVSIRVRLPVEKS